MRFIRSAGNRLLGGLAALSVVLSLGCSEDDEGVVIRGGERLSWNQAASSIEQLNRYQFILYVNGTPAQLSSPTCQLAVASISHLCSGGLPPLPAGQHKLELSAVEDGQESERSQPLVVVVENGGGTAGLGLEQSPLLASASSSPEPEGMVCVEARPDDCLTAEIIISGLGLVQSVRVVQDGRLFFIEDGARVRVVSGREVLQEAALTRERVTDRLIALGVGRDFQRTRWVHIAWTEESEPGSRTLTVARYREVQDRLGEPTVLLSGLPLPIAGDPQVDWDVVDRTYVAVPATPGQRLGRNVYGGSIVRFNSDGTTPWQSGQVSPVLAPGYALPSAIVNDDVAERLWVAGRRGDSAAEVRWLPWVASGEGPGARPQTRGVVGALTQGGPAIVSMTVVRSSERSMPGQMILLDEAGRLSRVSLTTDGVVQQPQRLAFGIGHPVGVASGSTGDVYVTARMDDGLAESYAIVRLAPRRQ